eukprot:354024-Chlamydomonas_euryale.AAC.3
MLHARPPDRSCMRARGAWAACCGRMWCSTCHARHGLDARGTAPAMGGLQPLLACACCMPSSTLPLSGMAEWLNGQGAQGSRGKVLTLESGLGGLVPRVVAGGRGREGGCVLGGGRRWGREGRLVSGTPPVSQRRTHRRDEMGHKRTACAAALGSPAACLQPLRSRSAACAAYAQPQPYHAQQHCQHQRRRQRAGVPPFHVAPHQSASRRPAAAFKQRDVARRLPPEVATRARREVGKAEGRSTRPRPPARSNAAETTDGGSLSEEPTPDAKRGAPGKGRRRSVAAFDVAATPGTNASACALMRQ